MSENPFCQCGCGRQLTDRSVKRGYRFASPACWRNAIRRSMRVCPTCEEAFKPSRTGQVHCSISCGRLAAVERDPDGNRSRMSAAKDVQRRRYIEKVRQEILHLTPPQETFTRLEVMQLMARCRTFWVKKGYSLRWVQEKRGRSVA